MAVRLSPTHATRTTLLLGAVGDFVFGELTIMRNVREDARKTAEITIASSFVFFVTVSLPTRTVAAL